MATKTYETRIHRKNSEPWLADKQAQEFGKMAKDAIIAKDAEKAGALAMFAARWAKRSLGGKR